ncbi:stAR-related lipid transfer protein 7, mitochondrial-like isoform X2 [Hylaeus anthracinus]|uniref:stAR-related lipid transfer protein 7, mitochondrial-like isoform X2 n=1 Tax=Hylaeus anthracinus TaxID=313031 RepID=UPI0023BA3D44|nr:stAR-related lipid transfer protein 7, mitochondrial-like isoform X2 [Hylaeus anthracinus]
MMYTVQLPGLLLKRFNTNYVQNNTRLASFGQYGNYGKFRECRKRINHWLKEQGGQVAEACTKQFEFIIAQRIRRSLQIFHLYTRIWDEVALKEFMKSWRNRALKNSRHFLMSSIGITMFNWDRERITEDELNGYKKEIEGIHRLRDSTVICAKCHLRIVIDTKQPDVKYCTCRGNKYNATSNRDSDGWTPYIERQDMLIWRREEPNCGGLFAYKVYGSFADVSAEDFLQTQIDVDYRKEWDPTARELQIIDTDPASQTSTDNRSDVIYWETIWPSLFANRDYVYQRRWVVDKERRLIIIISKGTDHPDAPCKPGLYRVTTYWSYMVIRPYTEFHQPGIEFGLTYFDDPGVNIPSAVASWVAMKGLPDFLIRMREASRNYQQYKSVKEDLDASNTNYAPLKDENISKDNILNSNMQNSGSELFNDKNIEECDEQPEELNFEEDEEENKDSTNSTKESRGLLDYFFLTKLFA